MEHSLKNWYEVVSKGSKGYIIAHGYIGPYDSISSKQFIKDFKALAEKHSEIDMDLHSGGGSVFDGNVIYNTIRSSKAIVNVTVSGIAASMGSILLQSATPGKRKAYKNARIMVHKPSGGAYGSAKKMRDTADQLDSIEASLLEIYMDNTGQDEATVKGWLVEGQDKWFTAKQALEAGLIDEIVDGPPVKAPKAKMAPEAMHQFYLNQFQSISNTTEEEQMNKALFVAMLATYGITASTEAAESELLEKFKAVVTAKDQKITELEQKNQELKNSLDAQKGAQITALLDGAVKDGKILASQKDQYKSLAEANYEATAAIINGLPAKASLNDAAARDNDAEGASGVAAERKDWDFKKWQKEDPKGLEKMRASNAKEYEALKAKYVSSLK